MSGPQAVRMLPMGVLYPHRGTTNKERRLERQRETHRWIWLPEHLDCSGLSANKFPLWLHSWSWILSTILYFYTLDIWCTCHQKPGLNPGGRRYRGAHTHPRGKRRWGYVNSKTYHSLHTLWPSSKMATRFMCAGPFASLVVVWNQVLRFFIYCLLNCELRKWCYMNWFYVWTEYTSFE